MKMPYRLLLQAAIPVIIVASVIALLMNYHSQRLTENEIAAFQERMLVAKRTVLTSYVSLARASIRNEFEGGGSDVSQAKTKAARILKGLALAPDAGLFVYDFNGNTLVHTRQPLLVGSNQLSVKGSWPCKTVGWDIRSEFTAGLVVVDRISM